MIDSVVRWPHRVRNVVVSVIISLLFMTASSKSAAYETDQFTERQQEVADSSYVMNRQINDVIGEIVLDWDIAKGPDRKAFVDAIYRKVGGRNWVDKIEKFAMFSPKIERIDAPRWDSIYGDLPFYRSRIIKFTGVSKTIRVGDTLIGTDKLGHFVSQGRKFYRRYLTHGSEAQAARRSAFTERGIFGSLLAGAYSNADLVANYEGHRFYRSLFEDDVVAGKESILVWGEFGWNIQREFDWNDHVNDYWDEALNVSDYDALLEGVMQQRFTEYCPDFWRNPSDYSVASEHVYRARYAHLQLRDTRSMRLDSLCLAFAEVSDAGDVVVANNETETQ